MPHYRCAGDVVLDRMTAINRTRACGVTRRDATRRRLRFGRRENPSWSQRRAKTRGFSARGNDKWPVAASATAGLIALMIHARFGYRAKRRSAG